MGRATRALAVMTGRRSKPHAHKDASDPLLDPGDQKRTYDRWRRRRLKSYHQFYRLLEGVDRRTCFYCRKKAATTLDHCPSLLMVDAVGVEYLQQQSIPLLLIPACRDCNNAVGITHAFRGGRLAQLRFNRVIRLKRNRDQGEGSG